VRGIGCAGCLRDLRVISYDSAQSHIGMTAQSVMATTVFWNGGGLR
jgi:hypothetical protein